MYALLFSKLPGPLWVRIVIATVAVAAVLAVLVVWVFPAIDTFITDEDVTF
jgi:hypothetical protein